jgi:hypothetical protein
MLNGKAKFFIFPILAGLIFLLGCATVKTPKSGFLVDYSEFVVDPQDKSLLWYEKQGTDWGRFKKLMLEPVVIYLHPEAKNRAINPDDLKKLADYFKETVIKEVQDEFPVVETPGADVLRIRAAITDVDTANPLVNVACVAAVGIPLDMGGAAIEAEFLDSETNERLGAVVDMKLGSPLDVQGFTSFGHAKTAFQEWARELKKAFKES